MKDTELAFTPAWRLAELIRRREVSPVELIDLMLGRISTLNPKLNAYLAVTGDEARAQARAAEKAVMAGGELAPLHGVPISIKDYYHVRGVTTTMGSLTSVRSVPGEDSAVVERVRRAGAIILGKTNTSEFGLSFITENRLGDSCRNPWNTTCTSGGSSGGTAAAVAAGLGPLGIGGDFGGSVRVPAAFCGIFGLKPTHGRIPNYPSTGVLEPFADIGPLARAVRDGALLLDIIAGPDRRDPYSIRQKPAGFVEACHQEIKGLRLAWSPDLGFARVDPEVRDTAKKAALAFQSLGCSVEEVALCPGEFLPAYNLVIVADHYAAYRHLLENEAGRLMPYVKSILEHGQRATAAQYSTALSRLRRFRMYMLDFCQGYDLLLCPTAAVPAFPIGQRPRTIDGHQVEAVWGPIPFTPAFNITGQPAASVPCGFSAQGLPVGLQIVGRWGEDATVIRAAAAFETIRPWANKTPAL